MNGKIICINKYLHSVLLSNEEVIECTTRGKIRNDNIVPLVGDNVIVDYQNKMIEKVLPRKNELKRPLVSNIDKLLIVMSTSIPSFSSYLIDKFLLIAYSNNIEPFIVITKMDTLKIKDKLLIRKYVKYYRKIGIRVYYNNQIKRIKKEFKNNTVALCGQTGAGKSTLLNKIDKTLNLETGEVSLSLGRGKHTTRLSIMIKLCGGFIVDTPGFSMIDINIKKNEIKNYYKDFNKPCRYKSCLHDKEDYCKIKELVKNKKIPLWRYNNYIKLLGESNE